jgi:SOS response regulatory protein OraA/RecX
LALWRFAEESVAWIFTGMEPDDVSQRILSALMQHGVLDDSAISALFHNNVPGLVLEEAKQALKRDGYIMDGAMPTKGRPRRLWKWISMRAA